MYVLGVLGWRIEFKLDAWLCLLCRLNSNVGWSLILRRVERLAILRPTKVAQLLDRIFLLTRLLLRLERGAAGLLVGVQAELLLRDLVAGLLDVEID